MLPICFTNHGHANHHNNDLWFQASIDISYYLKIVRYTTTIISWKPLILCCIFDVFEYDIKS